MTDPLEDLVRDVLRSTAAEARPVSDLADRALAERSTRRVRRSAGVAVAALATVASAVVVPLVLGQPSGGGLATGQRTAAPVNATGTSDLRTLGSETVGSVALTSYVEQEADGLYNAFVRNPDDGSFRRTTYSWALVSPDGTTAVALQDSFSTQLMLMDTRTGKVTATIPVSGVISTPYWSPDGGTIIATTWSTPASGARVRTGYMFVNPSTWTTATLPTTDLGGTLPDNQQPRDYAVHWMSRGTSLVTNIPCSAAKGALPGSPNLPGSLPTATTTAPDRSAATTNADDPRSRSVPSTGTPTTGTPTTGTALLTPTCLQTFSTDKSVAADQPRATHGLARLTVAGEAHLPVTAGSVTSADGRELLAEDDQGNGVVLDAASGSVLAANLPEPLGWADDGNVIAARTAPDSGRKQVVVVSTQGAVVDVLYTADDTGPLPQLFFTQTVPSTAH